MRGLRFALAAGIACLAIPTAASAKTFEVTKRGDPSPGACTPQDCSLREAVLAANAHAGPDKIVMPSRKLHQLSIGGEDDGALVGDLDTTNAPLRIVHPGRGRARIDFNPPDDGLDDPLDRIFDVFASLTLKRVTVTDGGDPTGTSRGAGLRAFANLTLVRSKVVGNELPPGGGSLGGGIDVENDADLVVRRSRLARNEGLGGAISFLDSGRMTIKGSQIVGNEAPSADHDGGAIYFGAFGEGSSITNSTIAGNRANDEGGAIYGDGGSLRITGTTFSKNRAGGPGGAIHVDGFDLSMINSTLSRNRSASNGGGIYADDGSVSLNAVTVARNLGNDDHLLSEAGGGLYAGDFLDFFRVRNSLIALNRLGRVSESGFIANDCSDSDPFDSQGHNLLSTAFLCDGFDAQGDIVRSNPRIARLGKNGGPTQTIALKASSPAIGKASKQSSPARDQRGRRRDAKPDIGAFER